MSFVKNSILPSLLAISLMGSGCVGTPSTTLERKLQELTKVKEISVLDIPLYRELIERGLNIKLLEDIEERHFKETYDGIISGRFPLFLFEEYETYGPDYSARAAWRDVDFHKGSEFAKEYIREKIESKDHFYKSATDYNEDVTQLEKVHDKYVLSLLKRYVDFFERYSNWIEIQELFEKKGEERANERGGYIIDGKQDYELVEIEQEEHWDMKNLYKTPSSSHYVHRIGNFHTHPSTRTISARHYAGPSGYSKNYGAQFPNNDMGVHRLMAKLNPFFMDCVISEIEEDKYNVDVYFHNIQRVGNKIVKDRDITVLDLGIYEF